jgi:MFS family permease
MRLPGASLTATLLAISAAIGVTGQQPAPTGVYTLEQAEAGRIVYDANCAGCHGPNLEGSSDAAALTGINFGYFWGPRPIGELFDHISRRCRPSILGASALGASALGASALGASANK